MEDAEVGPIDASVPFDAAWSLVQRGLRARLVSEINHRTLGGRTSPRPLIVLVHGFNNTAAAARDWYSVARDSIRGRVRDAVFLDVYWDGLTQLVPVKIWTSAQYNFPLVGLEFRRVLNAVDPTIPVRILTHSSGGPLIASTMGDASAPLPANDSAYGEYRVRIVLDTGEYRPPHFVNLRVAMIAPAAATNTFANYDRQVPGLQRLILGLNPRDYATGKLFLSCKAFGSACMTTSLEAFCTDISPRFERTRTRLYAFDFSGSRQGARRFGPWEDHGMAAYLKRDDISRVLNLLVGSDDVAETGEAPEFCRAYGASPRTPAP